MEKERELNDRLRKQNIVTTAVTGLCFLYVSTGYLAWTHHVMALAEPPIPEAITMVAAYLCQAAGIGLFSLMTRSCADLVRRSVCAALALHMLFLVPAVLGTSLAQALVFGLIQNLLCGWITGYYLYRLTKESGASDSAGILGIGYTFSIAVTWLMSVIGNGAIWHSRIILVICLIFTIIVGAVVFIAPSCDGTDPEVHDPTPCLWIPKNMPLKEILILSGALVLLFSIVNSCGYGFPSGDLEKGVDLEFSRLFYAAGLMIAGKVHDRSRRNGAVCAMTALVSPFLVLAIRGEPVSLIIFWALSYFTFGFYTVFRIILFSDIAREKRMPWLSGAGLLIGRVGDAVGETLCITLAGQYLAFVAVTALLFMLSVFLFFRMYQILYVPEAKRERSEREIFNHFSARHDLSAREREVLRFLLEEKTNQEIAELLSISEGTVKYHIHNLLQKTSCRNRLELRSAYSAEQDY